MHAIPRAARTLAACGAALALIAGCTPGHSDSDSTDSGSSAPGAGQLSTPVTLDFEAELLADNDGDRALVSDVLGERVVAIGADGSELWTQQAAINADRTEVVAAYTHGENVIVDDGTSLRAFAWVDGSEIWTYRPAPEDLGCETGAYYNSMSSTGGRTVGEHGVLLLEYWMQENSGENCADSDTKAMVIGLDPATGKPAWPAVHAPVDAHSMGGDFMLQVTPDHEHAYLPWRDPKGSYLSRIDLASGEHATVDLSRYGNRDLGFAAYPQQKAGTLVYAFGSPDPSEAESGNRTRTALLRVPTSLPESAGTLTPLSAADHPDLADGVTFDDTPAERCAARPQSTATGTWVCASAQLVDRRTLVFGSLLDGETWNTDLSEDGRIAGLFNAAHYTYPQVPVDGPEGPLVIMPGLDAGVRATSAADGTTVWEAGPDVTPPDPGEENYGYGGNGAFEQAGLIPVLLNDAVHFFTLDGTEPMKAHDVGEDAWASATSGWFAVVTDGGDDGDHSTILWTVTGG